MNFEKLINLLSKDTLLSMRLFQPELILCITIVLLLFIRLFKLGRKIDSFFIAITGTVAALAVQFFISNGNDGGLPADYSREIFTGLLIYDPFTVYLRIFLLTFTILFLIFTKITGIPDRNAGTDVYTLVLGGVLGMCLMASANHMLMIFMAVEMASVPSYVLAGLLRGNRKSSESALKYAIYGAATAGVMLYGISLLCGITGSAHLPTMANSLIEMNIPEMIQNGDSRMLALVLGGLMLMVGLAFKLSAVPFHFWCPDVFEGATAEVNAFLSIASKAAALALLIRVAVGLSSPQEILSVTTDIDPSAPVVTAPLDTAPLNVSEASVANEKTTTEKTALDAAEKLAPVRNFFVVIIGLLAAVSATFGNLAAYGQTNIKRLLAYSTIAHAGYMMMPIAAAIALLNQGDQSGFQAALVAVGFYMVVYLFMNLGAFAVVAFLRNKMQSEEIADYAGLIKSSPVMAICFTIILFSLIGMPPLAGFAGKFYLFASVAEAQMYTLLAIGGLNTAFSLFYYLRVIKLMLIDPESETRGSAELSLGWIAGTFLIVVTGGVVVFGLWWDGLSSWATAAFKTFI